MLRLTIWVLVCDWLLFLRNVKDCDHLKCFKSSKNVGQITILNLDDDLVLIVKYHLPC